MQVRRNGSLAHFRPPKPVISPRNVPDRKLAVQDLKIIFSSRDEGEPIQETGKSLDSVGRRQITDYG